ncbi:hypothetical protein D0Z07_2186 [Hyphodiscus hymeniophilus]|uniref:Uncharacterized protein n=1 Tax=Hyphodiscus hymeniophilus TaxID=353542 RepID=A0A9P7AZI9_9HELO|nr:hypothetical protein D0Z07_2186 [Hyphodiscus hymeniophilus]
MPTFTSTSTSIFLRDRASWPTWYFKLEADSTFRNIWSYVDPQASDAPHLIAIEPTDPLTTESLLLVLDYRRAEPIREWEADERPEHEKGARPRPAAAARFSDIKEELAARQKTYDSRYTIWVQRASRYQYIWDWV